MVKIITERLLIRDNLPEDLNDLHSLMSDSSVSRYDSAFSTLSLEDTKASLDISTQEAGMKNRKRYWFAIINKKTGVYIGQIGLTILSDQIKNGIGQLAYFIHKKFWGNGYTTEAAKRVIDFAFETVGIRKLITGCMKENAASEKIMKKCGLTKEAEKIQHVWHENKWKDRVEYTLLRDEWQSRLRGKEQSMDHQESKGSEEYLDVRVEHYMKMYGNCAQASFSALQEIFALECDAPTFVKALRPFPGIGLTFETCGAITGCLTALGLVYGTVDRTDEEQSRKCMLRAKEFCSKVAQELGSTRCGEIMERQFGRRFDLHDQSQREAFREAGAREKCTAVVKTAVRVANKLIQQSPEYDAR